MATIETVKDIRIAVGGAWVSKSNTKEAANGAFRNFGAGCGVAHNGKWCILNNTTLTYPLPCGQPGNDITIRGVRSVASEMQTPRDNKIYGTRKFTYKGRTFEWMVQNIADESAGIWNNDNASVNGVKYGRNYNWHEAMTLGFHNWHLPDGKDWQWLAQIHQAAGGLSVDAVENNYVSGIGTMMRTPNCGGGWWDASSYPGVNTLGWAGVPGGVYNGSSWSYINTRGFWWSATEYSSTVAYRPTLYYNDAGFYGSYNYNKSSYWCSVRLCREIVG